MRKLLRTARFSQVTRSSVPEYRPEVNDQKFKNWWSRLNNLSSRPASKVYLAQLSNLFAYFNRQVTDTTKVIQIKSSLSTLPHGRARSSPRDLWMQFKKTTNNRPPKNTIWTKFSTTSSPRIQKLSTKSYIDFHVEQ